MRGLPAPAVIAIMIVMVLAPANVAADPVTIFHETFPLADTAWDGSSDTAQNESGWVTIQGDGDADDIQVNDDNVGSSPSGGNHLTFVDCDHGFHTPEDYDIAYVSIDLSSYSGVEISYYWQDDDCDTDEGLRVAYSTNSTDGKDGNWTSMYENINKTDDAWVKDTYPLPAAACAATFKLRFSAKMSHTNEHIYVDDVMVTGSLPDTTFPIWSSPETNPETIYENDVVTFFTDWDDDVALSGYIFSTNQSGAWVNESFTTFSATPDTAEEEMTITASAGTTVGWRFYANDTSDNWNVTDIQSFLVQSTAPPPPSSPYMIYGWVFYRNGTACDNPVVDITNLNNSKQWQAETNASYNFYQITLASGTELNASEILQFDARAPDGTYFNTTSRTVTVGDINVGGLFSFNLTLPASPAALPYTAGHVPAKGATGVPVNTNIVVHVLDDGAGVNESTIVMTVDGSTVSPSKGVLQTTTRSLTTRLRILVMNRW